MEILTNKTAKTGQYFSRNNGFYYYYNKLDNKNQLSTKAWLGRTANVQETRYIVKEGDTYDMLALTFYNNPTYYWIICDYNRIIDPFVEPKKGDILYIPTLGTNLQFETYY